MKRFVSLINAGLCLVFCASIYITPTVLAVSSTSTTAANSQTAGQALEIAPPVVTATANPGETIKLQIMLRDVSKTKLLVTNEINDFVAAGEDGTPKVLLENDESNPFTMKSWILPLSSFELTPQQLKTVTINIKVPTNASPGGHYGVIRFTGTPSELEGNGVSLSASLGALVLLTVNGDLTHKLTLQEFSTNNKGKAKTLFEAAPVDFTVKIKNSGNIQELPSGHIVVSNMFGKKIATLNVNMPARNVLPSSSRKFTTNLGTTTIGSKKLFGRYHANLEMAYSDNKKLTGNIYFWVVPYRTIGAAIVLLILIFFILRTLVRRYNNNVIKRASRANPEMMMYRPKQYKAKKARKIFKKKK